MLMRPLAPVALAFVLSGCGAIGAIGLPPLQRSQQQPIEQTALPPLVGTMPDQAIREGEAANDRFASVEQAGGFGNNTGTDGFSSGVGSATPIGPDPNSFGTASTGSQATAPSGGGGGGQVGRTDLLGGWTIAADGESCRLFMTLTSWTGGYRASTRDCSSELLKSISAWNLNGSEVTLTGQSGTTVARLFSSGQNRFDGQTERQAPITFYR